MCSSDLPDLVLASRITDKARPGSVVVSGDFKDQVGDEGFTWSKLPGKSRFKGISGELDMYRVRRNGANAARLEP